MKALHLLITALYPLISTATLMDPFQSCYATFATTPLNEDVKNLIKLKTSPVPLDEELVRGCPSRLRDSSGSYSKEMVIYRLGVADQNRCGYSGWNPHAVLICIKN